ncbi:HipA N-terminal domain-containing protein [Algibacter pacificus]|uniref:HipA N-terminal domain-containing protein n=1 Tax=Algibacter pacificus TaxID=2599389 RepID=UPI0011C9CD33|nr:HipA N-terminal domain-containing protein [Algibacter pacificus]
MRQGEIWVNNTLAGILTEDDYDYSFEYVKTYLEDENAIQISVTLPLQKEAFKSEQLFPFFDGL